MDATITATVLKHTNNHSLVRYSANQFCTKGLLAYILKQDTEVGASLDIPANPIAYQKEDTEGKVMCTNDGTPLTFLYWEA